MFLLSFTQEKETELAALVDPNDPMAHAIIPMQSNIMKIPVQGSTVGMEMDSVNISEEMAKTNLWKTIVANESSPNLQQEDHQESSQPRQ